MYRVVRTIPRPPQEKIDVFKDAVGGILSRGPNQGGALDCRIQGLKREWHCVGPAFTVQINEPDATMPILATELAQTGDVIVVAAKGRLDRSCWGAGMTLTCKRKGLAGVIVDGAVHDANGILTYNLPVFCRAVTPAFELRDIPGSINVPVAAGGVLVHPGDLVIGTSDGVVVIPTELIDTMIEAWNTHSEHESAMRAESERLGRNIYYSMGTDKVIPRLPLHWED